MKCKQCGKEMMINLKFGISEFICECGYQTDEMAILNEELQYLRKVKEDYIDSDKALETAKLTAKIASDLMMASYTELTKKLNDDFDKKIKELKKQHIEEIKEAVKKARKRQTNQNIALVVESKSNLDGK